MLYALLRRCNFLLFENSKAIGDFDTKAVSKIDQKWRISARRRCVSTTSAISVEESCGARPELPLKPTAVREDLHMRDASVARVG